MNNTPCPVDLIIIGCICVNGTFGDDRFCQYCNFNSDDIIYDYKNRKSNCEEAQAKSVDI